MRSSTLMDGTVWNGTDPEGYARRFAIQRKGADMKHHKHTTAGQPPTAGEVITCRRCRFAAYHALPRQINAMSAHHSGAAGAGTAGGALAAGGDEQQRFPTPLSTLDSALTLFADPFYQDGPNDMGIGWNVLASLQRGGGLWPGRAGGDSAGLPDWPLRFFRAHV
jgi:hypothetical protein